MQLYDSDTVINVVTCSMHYPGSTGILCLIYSVDCENFLYHQFLPYCC